MAARFSTSDSIEPLPQTNEDWKADHLKKIKDILPQLPDREADLIRLYYFRKKRQTDIAEIFNITQAAVSYRLQRALERIRFLIEIPNVTKKQIFDDLYGFMSELDAQIFSEMFESTCQSEVADILDISQGRVRHRYIANLERLGYEMSERVTKWFDDFEDPPTQATKIRALLEEVAELQSAGADIKEIEDCLRTVVEIMRTLDAKFISEDLMRFADYYKTFLFIRYNFNIRREIRLPKWSSRPTKTLV